MASKKSFFQITRGAYKTFRKKIEALKEHTHDDEKHTPLKHHDHNHDQMVMHLSGSSVTRATLIVILLYALTQFVVAIHSILLVFFVSLLFSAAITPWVDKLEKKRIPRFLSVFLIYITLFAFLWVFVITFIPLVAHQVSELSDRIQSLIYNLVNSADSSLPFGDQVKLALQKFLNDLDTQLLISNASSTLDQLSNSLGSIAGNVWTALKFFFNGIINLSLVLILTFFMVLDDKQIHQFFTSLFPSRHGKYITEKTLAVKEKVGYWLRGQLLLMIWVGLLTFIGLNIIGLEYAATISLIAGITEVIPVLGPIVAFLFALPIALNSSIWLAFLLLIVFVVVQQIESNILFPIIMKKTVGLNPIVIIFVMLVGFQFLGILGIVLSVPVAAAANIFIQDYSMKEK